MIKGINPYEDSRYVSWGERHLLLKPVPEGGNRSPEKTPTTWIIRYPDVDMMEKIENESVKSETKGYKVNTKFTAGSQKKEVLTRCVRGWENMTDHKGQPAKWDPSNVKKNLDIIPIEIRDELYNELTGSRRGNRAMMEAAEEKGVPVEY